MIINFLNCIISKKDTKRFINVFKDGEIMGTAIFEFHNDEEFRIYIYKENEADTMLTFQIEK